MKIIYVSGPYRADTENEVFENIIRARSAPYKLWHEGWAVICPHTNTMFMGSMLSGEDSIMFIEGDLEIVKRCDAIYMLKGWEKSEGAEMELDVASERGLDVYYEEDQWEHLKM